MGKAALSLKRNRKTASMCFNQGHGTLLIPVDLSASENTEAETYILEQKYNCKIFSLYSKKAEVTGPTFKSKHFFLAFQGADTQVGCP